MGSVPEGRPTPTPSCEDGATKAPNAHLRPKPLHEFEIPDVAETQHFGILWFLVRNASISSIAAFYEVLQSFSVPSEALAPSAKLNTYAPSTLRAAVCQNGLR
jgi:hypothetical protein